MSEPINSVGHPHLFALLEREYLFSKKLHLFLLVIRVLTSWSSCVSLLLSWFSTLRLPAFIAQLGKIFCFLENGLVSFFFFFCVMIVFGWWVIEQLGKSMEIQLQLPIFTYFLFGSISRCKFCFCCGGKYCVYRGSITSIRCWFPCNFSWMRDSELQLPTSACYIVMQLFCWIEVNNFSVLLFSWPFVMNLVSEHVGELRSFSVWMV